MSVAPFDVRCLLNVRIVFALRRAGTFWQAATGRVFYSRNHVGGGAGNRERRRCRHAHTQYPSTAGAATAARARRLVPVFAYGENELFTILDTRYRLGFQIR